MSSGTGTLAANGSVSTAVTISASNPVPGATTNLTYKTTVARAGTLARIVMQMPAGASGQLATTNGSLTSSGGYLTWTPYSPLTVSAGAALSIPVNTMTLSRFGGIFSLAMSSAATDGSLLQSGTGTIALIAPPAAMQPVASGSVRGTPAGCPTEWPSTAVENALAGTTGWVIPTTASGGVSAYLSSTSATCGDEVVLKASSAGPLTVVAYRIGYYGGAGAREVWRQQDVPSVVQPAPSVGGTDSQGHPLNMVSAAQWTPTLTLKVDATWPPGTYLVRVADSAGATYAPLTVRDDTQVRHELLLQQATATWSAYNTWGGRGFYTSPIGFGSARVSYDRPYAEGQGSGQFLPLEQGLVYWLESKGLDVTYWTNEDMDRFGGAIAAHAKRLVLPSHDEYYSMTMRASLGQAIGQGVDVASLGANTVYRKITYTDASHRTWDSDRWTAAYDSTTWRWLGDAWSSQGLLGAEYVCATNGAGMTTGNSWLFSGITPGTAVPGFLAGEVDDLYPGLYTHPNLQVVATGTTPCRDGGTATMRSTAYTHGSGARVFNASVFSYSCYLVGRCPSSWAVSSPSPAAQQVAAQMTANVISWVSHGSVVVASASPTPMRAVVPKLPVAIGD